MQEYEYDSWLHLQQSKLRKRAQMVQKTYSIVRPYNSPDDALDEAKLIRHIINLEGRITVNVYRKEAFLKPKEVISFEIPQEIRTLDEAIKIGVIKLFPSILNGYKFMAVMSMHSVCEFLWPVGNYSISVIIPTDGRSCAFDVGLAAISEPKRYLTAYSELKEAFDLAVEQGRIPALEEECQIETEEDKIFKAGMDMLAEVRELNKNDTATWGPPGRISPCPCGSGLKFMHCHGKRK